MFTTINNNKITKMVL